MTKMNQNMVRIVAWNMIILIGFGIDCTRKTIQENETILAKIGDQTITVEEFQMRTEMTIRPKYPALNDESIKRICLNNLIAEKLMAIQGQKEKKLIENPFFKAQIKGIQEQSMREQLYSDVALKRARVRPHEIKRIFPLAGREYKVSFYSIYSDTLAKKFGDELKKGPQQFERLFYDMASKEKIPQKTVNFKDPDPVVVHDSLFSEPLDVGKVIGPLKIEENNYLLMKVEDWNYQLAISETDVQIRYHEVEKKLKEKTAYHKWRNYVTRVMRGKKIKFEKETFIQLAKIFFDIYGIQEKAVRNQTLRDYLNSHTEEIRFNNQIFKDLMLDQPFFNINGEVWTVRDFREAFMSHPLVFKYKFDNLRSFQQEFRMAIINLIRDHYLTKEAYKKKLDRNPIVKRTRTMWEDSYVATYHRDRYLNTILKREDFNPKLMKGKNNYLSLYVDSLQQKYSERIKINIEALDNIQLTHIDLFVLKPNVPYPVAVPSFPEYLQDGKLDYGNPMQQN
jgi:hypothetical protein